MAYGTPTTDARGRRGGGPRRRRAGLTLVEGLIAATVLGAAVVGLVGPLAASYQQAAVTESTTAAVSLARQLVEEIVSRPVEDPSDGSLTPGPEAGEGPGRGGFDNVDDYHGYVDSTDGSQGLVLRALDGSIPDVGRRGALVRSVTVDYRATPDGPAGSGTAFAVVTVTVTGGGARTQVTVRRLVARCPRGT